MIGTPRNQECSISIYFSSFSVRAPDVRGTRPAQPQNAGNPQRRSSDWLSIEFLRN